MGAGPGHAKTISKPAWISMKVPWITAAMMRLPTLWCAPGMAKSYSTASPEIGKHGVRAIVSGRAGHPAARMRAGAAEIKPLDRHAVIAVAQHRAGGKKLIQRQMAMHDVAGGEAEDALQIQRAEDLAAQDRGGKSRRMAVHGADHHIGDLLAMIL